MSNPYLYLYQSEAHSDEPAAIQVLPSCHEEMLTLCCEQSSGVLLCDCVIVGTDLSGLLLAYQAVLGGLRVAIIDDGADRARVPWRIPFVRQLVSANSLRVIPTALAAAVHMQRVVSAAQSTHRRAQGAAGTWFRRLLSGVCATADGMRMVLTSYPSGGYSLDFDEEQFARELLVSIRREGGIFFGSVRLHAVEPESRDGTYVCEVHETQGSLSCRIRCGGIVTDGELATIPFGRRRRTPEGIERPPPDTIRVVCHVADSRVSEATTRVSLGQYTALRIADDVYALVKALDPHRVEIDVVTAGNSSRLTELPTLVAEICQRSFIELRGIISARCVRSGILSDDHIVQRGGVIAAQAQAPWSAINVARRVSLFLEDGTRPLPRFEDILRRPLAGCVFGSEEQDFRSAALRAGAASETIERVWRRWRGRVRELISVPDGMRELGVGLMQGEVDLAFRSEHITSLSGIMFDALSLQEYSNWEDLLRVLAVRLGDLRGWEVSDLELSAALTECQVHLTRCEPS